MTFDPALAEGLRFIRSIHPLEAQASIGGAGGSLAPICLGGLTGGGFAFWIASWLFLLVSDYLLLIPLGHVVELGAQVEQ